MNIHESGENYLETILILATQNTAVRSVDVAERLGVTKASVSRAMGILRQQGYIDMPKNGAITLTVQGKAKAAEVYERHRIISRFLIQALTIDEMTAEQDACRIEHIISKKTFAAIQNACRQFDEAK